MINGKVSTLHIACEYFTSFRLSQGELRLNLCYELSFSSPLAKLRVYWKVKAWARSVHCVESEVIHVGERAVS